ncbi:DUF2231 domain-containing protein [Subtercola boreus]|uniref:Uncharacterized protein n=1 Tax=Subtercola boreus TaxID=120213 RepID=A0A3E0W5W3_9MICO|nr:DUF2231 domain-containing protein [Subtercola boreus]RFA17912.1 hypothetical protein B7R24_14685 [Subtercola boreus]RFA18294.1 hypothetical protein B7R23_14720 [Subtercola boreus]RFA24824.1 hypothetical protein B7R25_14715 [Subtercola boreus]
MLPYEVNGLPLHILLVHVVVIVLPAAALMTVLGAVWPAFRRRLGVLTPLVALIGLVSVPLATNAGEWLEARVTSTPLIQAHVALGDTLLPWAVGLFLVSLGIWVWYRWFAAVRVPAEGRGVRAGSPRPAGSLVPAGFAAPGTPAADSSGDEPLHGDDPYAPLSGAATTTPGVRPTAPARARVGRTTSAVVSVAWIVLALVVSTGTVVKVVQIGESGSSAVWQGSFSTDPVEG